MIIINLHEIFSDIIGFSSSLIYALIMLTLGFKYIRHGKHYPSLLLSVGFGAVIEFVITLSSFLLEIRGIDSLFLRYYFIPAGVSIEVSMSIFAILYIFYIGANELRSVIYAYILFFVTILLYPFAYSYSLAPSENFFDIANYTRFAETTFAEVLTQATNASMFILLVLAIRSMVRGYMMFRSTVGMFLSSDNTRIRKKFAFLMTVGIFYIVISCFGFLVDAPWMKHAHRYTVVILCAIIVLIILCNMKEIDQVENAFHNIKRQSVRISYSSFAGIPAARIDNENQPEDVQRVRALFEHWANRPDHPYMQPNITIQSFADYIGLPVDVIVKYGNMIYGCPFREWILSLRD